MTVSLSASVLIALSCSFLSCVGLCAVLLPPAERVMARRRVAVVEVPSWRKRQQDLPPVGGIAIIVSAAAGILISAVFGGSVSENCIFLLIVAVLFSAVGLTDDLLTLTQNKRFSMHSSVKTILRALLAVGFAVYSYNYNGGGYVPLSVFASGVDLGVFYIPIAALTVLIFSCSAMITDGSDGLNAVTSVPVFAYLMIFSLGRQGSGDAEGAFVSSAILGAVLGFLVFGKCPARIFSGKSGTSFCGVCAVLLCFLMKRPAVMFTVGFVWLVQGMSFALSRAVYYITRGKHRLLPIAPLDVFLRSAGVSENVIIFAYFAVGVIFAAVSYVLTGGL